MSEMGLFCGCSQCEFERRGSCGLTRDSVRGRVPLHGGLQSWKVVSRLGGLSLQRH